MTEYYPDRWIAIKVDSGEDTYIKIFGSWGGGYLSGDSWRINSGVVSYTEDEDHFYFNGSSGSVYKCYKNAYGVMGSSNYGVVNAIEKLDYASLLSYDELVKELEEL